jgi:hypothetical protein
MTAIIIPKMYVLNAERNSKPAFSNVPLKALNRYEDACQYENKCYNQDNGTVAFIVHV